jgi:spermidine synthase
MDFIKDEMLTHIPMCVHPEPKKVLLIGENESIASELKKHQSSDLQVLDAKEALLSLQELDEGSVDVIIVSTKLFESDRVFWGLVKRVLSLKGVVSSVASSLVDEEIKAKAQIETMGEYFRIVMPYVFMQQHCEFALFASNMLHPTADINLQRADLTEGFRYYNSDIAIAAFAMPNMIRKEFRGLIKS